MSYQVFWVTEAEEELAAIWLDADDRNAIATAAHVIDIALRLDPETVGESRGEGRRIFWEPPLGVIFIVSSDDRIVSVLNVWRFETGRKGS
jgi:hypothetical protein